MKCCEIIKISIIIENLTSCNDNIQLISFYLFYL